MGTRLLFPSVLSENNYHIKMIKDKSNIHKNPNEPEKLNAHLQRLNEKIVLTFQVIYRSR